MIPASRNFMKKEDSEQFQTSLAKFSSSQKQTIDVHLPDGMQGWFLVFPAIRINKKERVRVRGT